MSGGERKKRKWMEKRRSSTIIWMNDKRHPPRILKKYTQSSIPFTTTIASHNTATKKQFINRGERLRLSAALWKSAVRILNAHQESCQDHHF
jgi:hypothetical protein